MGKKKHEETKVIASLSKKHDIAFNGKSIYILNGESKKEKFKPKNDLGNGSWGKIDYLVNHLGYRIYKKAEF